ncbi:MAG: DMT family transporter [Rubrivivax sp.]|nr:DMT family transporter [Rubrivivax sp.]
MTAVPTALAATLCIQIGYFLWKLAADRIPRIGHVPAFTVMRAMVTEPLWLTGLVATIAGWLLFIQATAVGEISVVQPLMSAGDLLLVLLAVVFLRERLRLREWFGVTLVVLGAAALAVGAGDSGEAKIDGVRLVLLLGAVAVFALGLLASARRTGRAEVSLALVVGLAFGAGAVLTKAMTTQRAMAGLSPASWTLLLDPMLAAVVGANVVGLVLLQAAFQRGRASVIVPLQLAVASGVTVLAAVTAFDETVTPSRAMAIAAIVVGTAMLHVRSQGAAEA